MPEFSVASLSSVKVPPIVSEAAQDIPNLRRHPLMLPAVGQNYITTFARSRPRNLADAELCPTTPSRHIMVMAAALRQFTVEEVEAFPYDGNRYELLHGLLLVTPQPGLPHQVVASRLMLMLGMSLVDEPSVQLYAPGLAG